jgi:hypothetical protein
VPVESHSVTLLNEPSAVPWAASGEAFSAMTETMPLGFLQDPVRLGTP